MYVNISGGDRLWNRPFSHISDLDALTLTLDRVVRHARVTLIGLHTYQMSCKSEKNFVDRRSRHNNSGHFWQLVVNLWVAGIKKGVKPRCPACLCLCLVCVCCNKFSSHRQTVTTPCLRCSPVLASGDLYESRTSTADWVINTSEHQRDNITQST